MRLERWGMVAALAFACAGCVTTGGDGPGARLKQDSKADEARHGAEVHTELGRRYMEQGNLEGAMAKLNIAVADDPSYAPAHTVLAVLYERIKDPANAEIQYKKAVELDPKKGDANNNLAVFLCQQGRAADARPYFDRALADPFYGTPDVALSNAGTCALNAKDYDGAEVYLRKALDRNPRNADALFQMANVLYLKNDAFRARAFLQRFEALGIASPDALKLGHDIELRLGNGEVAQDYAKRLRAKFPDSDPAHALEATARQ